MAARRSREVDEPAALQGSRRDESRAAVGDQHGSIGSQAPESADRRRHRRRRDLHHADGRRGRAAPRVYRVERTRRAEPGRLAFAGSVAVPALFLMGVTGVTSAAGLAAFPGLGARGWNSKPILLPGVFTRKALNFRFFLDMNP